MTKTFYLAESEKLFGAGRYRKGQKGRVQRPSALHPLAHFSHVDSTHNSDPMCIEMILAESLYHEGVCHVVASAVNIAAIKHWR